MMPITARSTVEFFFDFMSPTSYLAHTQLPRIADRVGAEIIWRPMLTLQLHELTENRSPTAVPNKARWIFQDLLRFAGRYGVPFVINPNLPFEMKEALHGALVAAEKAAAAPAARAMPSRSDSCPCRPSSQSSENHAVA